MIKLYKLHNADTGKNIHLFGAFHNIGIEHLSAEVVEFIMNHNRLIVESKNIFDPITYEQLKKYEFNSEKEENIVDTLSPNQFSKLKEIVSKFLKFKNSSEISFTDLNITGLFHILEQGQYLDGMDTSIVMSFRREGKFIDGLETRDELAHFFKKKSIDELKQQLDTVLETDNINKDFIKFYCKIFLNSSFNFQPNDNINEEIIIRNKAWLNKILQTTREEIICVGAFHLYGDDGLLNLISSQGYTVEQMDESGKFKVIDESSFFLNIPNNKQILDYVLDYLKENYGIDQYCNFYELYSNSDISKISILDLVYDFFNINGSNNSIISCTINEENSIYDVNHL